MAALGPRPLEALRVGDAAARRHPVDLTRPDRLLGGEAVAVHDLAVDKIGDGRKADMRMRAHVHRAGDAGRHVVWAPMIVHYATPHHPPLRIGLTAPPSNIPE